MTDLSKYIDGKETSDLPNREKALALEDSADLAKSIERTNMFVLLAVVIWERRTGRCLRLWRG